MSTCAHCFEPINPDHFHVWTEDSTADLCAECETLPSCEFCGDRIDGPPLEIIRLEGGLVLVATVCSVLCARIVRETPEDAPWPSAQMAAIEQQSETRRAARQAAAAARHRGAVLAREPVYVEDSELPI